MSGTIHIVVDGDNTACGLSPFAEAGRGNFMLTRDDDPVAFFGDDEWVAQAKCAVCYPPVETLAGLLAAKLGGMG